MVSLAILSKQSEILNLFTIMQQISCAIYDTVQQDEEPGERLLELLQQRTKTMEEVDVVYEVLDYGLKELINNPQLATGAELEEIKRQKEKISNLITEIMELDRKSLEDMNRIKDSIALKLQQSRTSSKAQKAYLQEEVYTEGWFIDKKK